ncbi:MAG: transcriptional repressor [Fidelibacterota bacterium]|nr:MAG: transcriptional repressor [Candidatus Neomarinimicrobiota bacterium]
MRKSKQRDAILQVLQGTDSHPTAEWIFSRVRREIPNISLGTVYRNLNQLADGHLIQRIFDDGHLRFDANLHRHDHFRCIHCQRILDLEVELVGLDEAISDDDRFNATGYSLEVTGVCNECQHETEEI